MATPIRDAEASYYDEGGLSFDPIESDHRDQPAVSIVHHNGEATIYEYVLIEEIDVESQTIRVWYDGETYEDFHIASIVKVSY